MSDVHANPAALGTALADSRENGCGKCLLLGDMTGYGYDAKSVVDRCMREFDVVLMGNHDAACTGLDTGLEVRLNPNYDIDRQQRDELSKEQVGWIKARDCTHEERDFVCVHGDVVAPREWGYILDDSDAERNFRGFSKRILFCGHSHHAVQQLILVFLWQIRRFKTYLLALRLNLTHVVVKTYSPQLVNLLRNIQCFPKIANSLSLLLRRPQQHYILIRVEAETNLLHQLLWNLVYIHNLFFCFR